MASGKRLSRSIRTHLEQIHGFGWYKSVIYFKSLKASRRFSGEEMLFFLCHLLAKIFSGELNWKWMRACETWRTRCFKFRFLSLICSSHSDLTFVFRVAIPPFKICYKTTESPSHTHFYMLTKQAEVTQWHDWQWVNSIFTCQLSCDCE